MALMPLSSSWAAVSRYCQHEANPAVSHFGHHRHQHQAVDQTESSTDQAKTVASDLDCGTCHFGCSMAMQDSDGIRQGEMPRTFTLSPAIQWQLVPVTLPDRPQWLALA